MENETPADRKVKRYALMRSVMDYGMGAIILGFGVFFFFAPKLGFNFEMSNLFRYSLSGLFVLYGGWRIYRGYQKNYFR
ncbi:MAG TPA: hypothetical protein VK787_05320 [Puia sp.]|jgi:hypothetical protein|nr:hypothetical protein [Puia sp.]